MTAPHSPLVVVHAVGRLSPGGGVQIVVRRMAQAIDPKEVELHVITNRPAFEQDQLDEIPVVIHAQNFTRAGFRVRDRIRLAFGIARTVRRLRADVVQVHSGTAWLGLAARVAAPRTPFVLEVHDAPGSGRHGHRTDAFEGWCVRRLGLTAVSHSSQVDAEVQRLYRPAPGHARCFPLGVDTAMFAPTSIEEQSAWRRANGFGAEETIVIAIGRPARSKRFDLAIDAVAAARRSGVDACLVVIGVGDLPALREHAASAGVSEHVHLWDARYGVELAAAISAADMLSSTSEYEGFGLTLAEAMACATPVVAMAVGGVVDLIDDGVTGFLVTPGDLEEHAERIVQLAGDRDLAARMGVAGRSRTEQRFSLPALAANFTRLYQELAAK